MNQSISRKSENLLSDRSKKLLDLLRSDRDSAGEIQDASVCNGIAVDLYNLRVKSNITQKELAERLGVKQSNISRWEKPGYQGYKVKMLSKIARTLGGRLWIDIRPIQSGIVTWFVIEQMESNKFTFSAPDGESMCWEQTTARKLEGISLTMKGETSKYAFNK